MNKNILTLISSIVVSSAWFFGAPKLPMFQCTGDSFSCVGPGMVILFIHSILIPIIFGILGYFFSKEARLKQAFYSFVISFIVSLAIFLPGYITGVRENNLKNTQDVIDIKARYEASPEQYKQKPY